MQLHNLNLEDGFVQDLRERLTEPDMLLGKGLNMPNNAGCSGGRKILFGTQREHVIPIVDPEVPFVQTGYEQQFGEWSSSVINAEDDCQVVAKLDKYPSIPNFNYYLILLNNRTNKLDIIHRVPYKHLSESYGYEIDNDFLDNLKIGDGIHKGTVIQKSKSYDVYQNRKDGINALTANISMGFTEEDGIVVRKAFADRMATTLIHTVSIIINDNDIPLNMFGDNSGSNYKVLPDIGEAIPAGILAATRRENKEESLFSQAYIRLSDIFMSDEKYTTEGVVVDIDIHSNNPDILETNPYYGQLNKYYRNDINFCMNLVNVVNDLKQLGYGLSYDLDEMTYIAQQKIDKVQNIKDKLFSNMIVDVTVIERKPLGIGDKVTDRYGGKGVVVAIWEDDAMPMISDGSIIDIIFNKSSTVNRLNSQLFEISYNYITRYLISYMIVNQLEDDECMELIYRFFDITNPSLSQFTMSFYDNLKIDEKHIYVECIKQSYGIYQSYRPISECSSLDILDRLYKEFPWIKPYDVYVPQADSTGRIRRVRSRRPIVSGTKYIYRLKQYAEEKFSTTSLSPTNIRNGNSKSRSKKLYREPYPQTPIRSGEMETGNFGHMGFVYTVMDLLMYSTSPHARRAAGEALLTGNPFFIDIKLDRYSSNVEVQILNTLLKTIGLRLEFVKRPKKLKAGLLKMPFIREKKKPDLVQPFERLANPTERDYEIANILVDHQFNHNGTGLQKPFVRLGIYRDPDYYKEGR